MRQEKEEVTLGPANLLMEETELVCEDKQVNWVRIDTMLIRPWSPVCHLSRNSSVFPVQVLLSSTNPPLLGQELNLSSQRQYLE